MGKPEKYPWFHVVIFVVVVYLLVGIVFPNPSASDPMQFIWRLAAWAISIVTFGFHVWYEHFRLGSIPRRTAMHTSLAVALAAFGLAAAAFMRSLQSGAGNRQLLAFALVIWPIMTGVPAFGVAFVAALGLKQIQPKNKPKSKPPAQ